VVSICEPYQLIDFGDGRKLEQFGDYLIDRCCPSAEGLHRRYPSRWIAADARHERIGTAGGNWRVRQRFPKSWCIEIETWRMELRTTASGQVGMFPEQIENWIWLAAQLNRRGGPARLLNLFAYTGGSSLSAAAAGAEVVHVDSAKSAVSWARRNADLSGLGDAPIRWIVEDAARFVRREIRRGNRYDAIVLDPPSYGHGPKGETWKMDRHLRELLVDCAHLVRSRSPLLLLTCHTPGFDDALLKSMLSDCFPRCDADLFVGRPLRIRAEDGRHLASGAAVRWPG
jgi:23S rRNA (cytosine1962-C5)-methyltransferase